MNDTLAQRLLSLPAEIEQAEQALRTRAVDLELARQKCQEEEDAILLQRHPDGWVLLGKNAETRAAELRFYLREREAGVAECEAAFEQAKITLHRKVNEFVAAKAVARLLSGGGE